MKKVLVKHNDRYAILSYLSEIAGGGTFMDTDTALSEDQHNEYLKEKFGDSIPEELKIESQNIFSIGDILHSVIMYYNDKDHAAIILKNVFGITNAEAISLVDKCWNKYTLGNTSVFQTIKNDIAKLYGFIKL